MKIRILNVIQGIIDSHFKSLLLAGAFPKCQYKEEQGWRSYSMFEYSNTYARLAKLVDAKMKKELDPELGVFTRKHSKAFLAQVEELVKDITEAEVEGHPERFHTFADSVLESM